MLRVQPFCPYCGQSMRFSELREHEQSRHKNILDALSQPGWEATVQRPCMICGSMVTAATIKAHMKIVHPRIARYVLFVQELVWGVALGWTWGFLALVVLYLVHVLSDFQVIASTVALTAFLAIIAVWLRTFALRHLLRLRSAWKPTTQIASPLVDSKGPPS